ncbi:hypothetical protein HYT02_05575 [Candidatus Gottesmanbacteria bacterium]|nr:hypothetical protein [Candidatus Gottesmanbacteria bacterium]
MKRFLIGAAAAVVMYASMAVPAFTVNPADAPANQIGTTVAGIAQSSDPNFGQAVCKPAGLTQTEDDGTLLFLGLTPPGNTP